MPSSKTGLAAFKRLAYEKPVLRSISLVANQVLGTGCKQTPPNVGLPLGSNQILGCIVNNGRIIDGA